MLYYYLHFKWHSIFWDMCTFLKNYFIKGVNEIKSKETDFLRLDELRFPNMNN